MLILDVGCGGNKVRGTLGVDRLSLPGVDIVCDFEQSPLPFKENSVDVIYTRHTLEHISDLEHILREFLRVLKPDGRLSVTVPHFSNALGYSDYTHKRFFGYYTFDYFSKARDPHWGVPHYTTDIWFKIVSKRFNFRNLSILGPIFDAVFNRGAFLPYFYESKLSWALPCFEMTFELRADKS
jgi:SAM-dependent methyltransferase